jgi:ectoine hydroxylase-related dioxygenase (phytanoyl-CoA dioxygenase family)
MDAQPRLVRALFFDKPPDRRWSLPWHRDTNIAVAISHGAKGLPRVSIRAGVPHMNAPRCVLERMLTIRLHLDAASEDNGALWVAPGSHKTTVDDPPDNSEIIETAPGDVVLMKPLILHRSHEPAATTKRRRVVHLEYSPDQAPGPGMEWASVWSKTATRGRSVNQ